MNKKERHEAILRLIGERPDAAVPDLSRAAGVSEVTIRKDLQQLEREGRIVRSYGRISLPPARPDGAAEAEAAAEGKRRIGALAADFVEDEDLIFLGPGQTCAALAENLRGHRRLSVITMNITAAMALAGQPEFELLTLPGDFTRRGGAYYVTGTAAMEYARGLYADKLFITADGFDPERGFSVLDEITAQIYHALIKPGTRVYVFVTAARFSRNARAPLGPLGMAEAVLTDARPPEAALTALEAQGIRVHWPEETSHTEEDWR